VEQQQDLQKRLLLALVLSFLVFIVFDMVMPKTTKMVDNNTTTQSQSVQQAPSNESIQTQTPKASSTQTATSLPASSTSAPVTTVKALTTINSDRFVLSIDELGRIAQVRLLEKKYQDEGKELELLNPAWIKPLELRFADQALNKEALKTPYSASASVVNLDGSPKTVTLTQTLSSTTVTKKITFYKDGHYDIKIDLSSPAQYFITTGERPDADHSRYMVVRGVMVRNSNGTTTIVEDGDAEGSPTFPNAKFTAAFDRYHTSILYRFEQPINVSYITTPEENALVFVQGEPNMLLHGYIGPKEYKVLAAINPELTEAIEYGWFTFISKPLFSVLQWFHNLVGNWGWAIVLVTLLIKLILFPLSYKGMMSMQKLKDLAPKMKEIKEKYGKDPQKMNAQMMELYKKHGANPMGGCLPMILQIPIFFAIYRVLLNAVELKGAEWTLWITDLSLQDPYFVLPLLMGISMWYQQRITPNTMTDPMQQKIFQWLPAVMTVFFITFPAGLVLYWLVNNIFTIGQQYVINSAYEKQKASQIKK